MCVSNGGNFFMTRKIKVDGAKGGGKGNGKNSTTDSGGVYAASVLSPASAALSITIDAEGGADTLAPVLQSFSSTTADGVYGPAAVSRSWRASMRRSLRAPA